MSSRLGARVGPYEITGSLGAGGMGEVYRARDARLKRDVALKILPESFATDPERVARFQREAEVLAALNHPNIAAIYGVEQTPASGDGGQLQPAGTEGQPTRALVLELVEGKTLADRIAGGAIPVDETVTIARQIAEALEAAHEQGIIHRDLKPANIKLRPDGTVKVLDFGLAKALEPIAPTTVDATASPTITSPTVMTGVGVLLGTAAYMSPEQARGRAADRRSDIWAFGCVLYEMLTGKPAFAREDVTDTVAAVLRDEPKWNELPVAAPESVRTILKSCLNKDAFQRMSGISVARFLLSNAASRLDSPATEKAGGVAARQIRLLRWAAAFVVALVATAVVWWSMPQPTYPTVRLTLVPSPAQGLYVQGFYRDLDVSPDGTRVVYVAGSANERRVVIRAIDSLESVPLRGGEDAAFPFVSPDGSWVGFFSENDAMNRGGELKKIPIAGGQPITICRFYGPPRGATWSSDGTIVFATREPPDSPTSTGLLRVSDAGGEPTAITKPDAGREEDHMFPSILPGGKALLFTVMSNYDVSTAAVAVLELTTGRQRTLIRGASDAQYVEGGYVVYASSGALYAVQFDLNRLEIVGQAVPIVKDVATLTSGAADFRASSNTLVYVSGEHSTSRRSLAWVTRAGREEPIDTPPREYTNVRLSPDGTRAAVEIGTGPPADLWLWDMNREALTRLTVGAGALGGGVWMPDAKSFFFGTARDNAPRFSSVATDTLQERRFDRLGGGNPSSVSADGKIVFFNTNAAATGSDIWVLRLDGDSPAREPLIQTKFDEGAAEISPDGRWLAYQADDSGRSEVYVRPFPQWDAGRWQVSRSGGSKPAWSPDGRELFFLGPEAAVMQVQIRTAPKFDAGVPQKLFDGSSWYSEFVSRQYDVSRDAQKFLVIKNKTGEQTSGSPNITVVLNWQNELKRVAPAN